MDIRIDEELMKEVVSAAILTTLTDEKKETLIKGAIAHLLTPTNNGYGIKGVSPMQQAFNSAVSSVARDLLTKKLQEDEALKNTISSLVNDAVLKLMTDKRKDLVDRMASNLSEAMTGVR